MSLIGESVFDSKILGGSKEFQNRISGRNIIADITLKKPEDFLKYLSQI